MVYGYVRVSTAKQDPQRQIRNILAFDSTAQIFSESYTGRTIDRPVFSKLLQRLQRGDTLICDSVSRMSRTADEGAALYVDLYGRGVKLVFLNERFCDSDVYAAALAQAANLPTMPKSGDTVTDDFLNAIRAALEGFMTGLARRQFEIAFRQAQTEADDIRERTRQGIQTARERGAQIGQRTGAKLNVKKAAATKTIIQQHNRDFGGTLTDAETMKLAGVSRNSFYKYKRELKSEN